MMPPGKPLTVVKLSDQGGQCVLTLTCECGHTSHQAAAVLESRRVIAAQLCKMNKTR
jgi:hypothetical protein